MTYQIGVIGLPHQIGAEREAIMAIEKSTGFMGNVERAIAAGKFQEISKVTAEKPVKVGENDGIAYYQTCVVVAVDERFPTKAVNTTTAVMVVPLDGAKQFETASGNVLKFDGIPPFIYAGRGVSHVFTVVNTAGDVVKRTVSRRSASAEIDEIKKQLAAIAAMLAAK